MESKKERAAAFLNEFKGADYVYGLGRLDKLGGQVASLGHRASVVSSTVGRPWGRDIEAIALESLDAAGIELAAELIPGARPNAPREDVFRIADALAAQNAEVIVAIGGGSNIDATKAAIAYLVLRDTYSNLDDYFGVGQLSRMLEATGRALPPLAAVQVASSSAAHLTKYSNITNVATGQKLLIVDDAIVPPKCLFDYEVTVSMSKALTMDGALDGVAHCLEVLYGIPEEKLGTVRPVSLLGIDLVVNNLKAACEDAGDLDAREALGLGTDLGGYAIMIGGTNGGHLTSFSLVDVLSHGRACALMNPYYTVFFAPAIEERLRAVGAIYKEAGYTTAALETLDGQDLGLTVAQAMVAHARDVGFPTTLREVDGFTDGHIERALTAAKNPKLDMKLKNMPVPLSADTVDEYMGPILEAATTGDFSLIKTMS